MHIMLRGMKHDVRVVKNRFEVEVGAVGTQHMKETRLWSVGKWICCEALHTYTRRNLVVSMVRMGVNMHYKEMDERAQLDHNHRNSMGTGRLRCLTRSPASLVIELRRSPRRRGFVM